MHLPKSLVLARLQKARDAIESFFVAFDGAERFVKLRCDLTQHDLTRLPCRFQLQHSRTRITDDVIDLVLERTESTFLPGPFPGTVLRPPQQSLAGGNCENDRCESQALQSCVLEVTLDHADLGRIAQVGLLQNENGIFQPSLLDKAEKIPRRL